MEIILKTVYLMYNYLHTARLQAQFLLRDLNLESECFNREMTQYKPQKVINISMNTA